MLEVVPQLLALNTISPYHLWQDSLVTATCSIFLGVPKGWNVVFRYTNLAYRMRDAAHNHMIGDPLYPGIDNRFCGLGLATTIFIIYQETTYIKWESVKECPFSWQREQKLLGFLF